MMYASFLRVVRFLFMRSAGRCASAVAVFEQQRHAWERASTDVTMILFDVIVSLQVRSQVRSVSERSLAVRTGKRFFAGVRSYVTLQEPRSRERLAAQSAATRKSVCTDVHLESARRRVCFVALWTSLILRRSATSDGREAGWLLGSTWAWRVSSSERSAVELSVLRQTADCRVTLLTCGTSEPSRRRWDDVRVVDMGETTEWAVLWCQRFIRELRRAERNDVSQSSTCWRLATAAARQTVDVWRIQASRSCCCDCFWAAGWGLHTMVSVHPRI